MWETVKNALSSVKEATGIEIPELPADLGSIGESTTTALQSLTESATATTEAATADVEGMREAATTAADSASQALPDITGGLIGGSAGR